MERLTQDLGHNQSSQLNNKRHSRRQRTRVHPEPSSSNCFICPDSSKVLARPQRQICSSPSDYPACFVAETQRVRSHKRADRQGEILPVADSLLQRSSSNFGIWDSHLDWQIMCNHGWNYPRFRANLVMRSEYKASTQSTNPQRIFDIYSVLWFSPCNRSATSVPVSRELCVV